MAEAKPGRAAIGAFKDFVEEADRILYLSIRGITGISASAELVEAVAKLDHEVDGALPEDEKRRVDSAYLEAEMAAREIQKGFPLLHAHTVVAIWGALESLIPEIVISWLKARPEALQGEEFSKLRVSVSTYESLDRDQQLEFLVDLLVQAQAPDRQPGVGRFEALLNVVGLGGAIDQDVRRDLLEMSQVRNLIVHRRSVVDQKFKTTCPWLEVKLGERLNLSDKDQRRYGSAVMNYVAEIVHRIGDQLGIETRGTKDE